MHLKISFGFVFLIAAIVLAVGSVANAEETDCHVITMPNMLEQDTGYGSPLDFFRDWRTPLMRNRCDEEVVIAEVGNGRKSTFIYKTGYVYQEGQWVDFDYAGENMREDWLIGEATAELPLDEDNFEGENYYLAYVCQYIYKQWKCGCTDRDCESSFWQVQSFEKPEPEPQPEPSPTPSPEPQPITPEPSDDDTNTEPAPKPDTTDDDEDDDTAKPIRPAPTYGDNEPLDDFFDQTYGPIDGDFYYTDPYYDRYGNNDQTSTDADFLIPNSATESPEIISVESEIVDPTNLEKSIPNAAVQQGNEPQIDAMLEHNVNKLINAYRNSLGLPPLSMNTLLVEYAREHSMNMAQMNIPVGHDGLAIRAEAIYQEIEYTLFAENVLSESAPTPESVVSGWLSSPEHRYNIESDFTLTGVGAVTAPNGTVYATQLFLLTEPNAE
jgi:uncharacterized protein YkwD